ncbi:MAG: aminotransferase class I/II-fold pyridoxal phosphate-dependent enzyme [Rhodothalassiaceae bacterium]
MKDGPLPNSLTAWAKAKLAALDAAARRRRPRTVAADGAMVQVDGRWLVNFSANDYLGLAQHPRLIAAAQAAAARHGTGAGASPLVTGRHPLQAQLEAALASAKGRPAALVFPAGYQVALTVVPALAGPADRVFIDALAHNCLHMGARLSGAAVQMFAHNDVAALAAGLAQASAARQTLILTDTVFSMDGNLAPLPALADLAAHHHAWLLADDAHGTGVVDVPGLHRCALVTGTLSKALGAQGGFVAADGPVIELLRNRARGHVYSTALAPPAAAAALEALALAQEQPQRRAQALALARQFCRLLGLPDPVSPIVPVILGRETAALDAQAALEAAGHLVVAIRPPTVPEGTARLRVSFSAAHSPVQVDALARALQEHLA